ncbi:Mitochondrial coenzyme A transporter SLC25A42 [Seminavis robusta]|uniref:Mitochondrial coenzyme A transporter SLC25A42 n=1 Tax=Seminavis robusta TaxID=568900 RepID=A0A9N8EAX3_9STRA|nr:Mitochondrial coenzyme A transporter SLC25A42 [Seminavis robusta]|eukprot:Sro691_g187880.1 Mitochondrial coenzyme A transporter SLC25A42 (413) ;mRNA; r:32295-33533
MTIQRRKTIPQELDDPEDVCVNQATFEDEEDEEVASSSLLEVPPDATGSSSWRVAVQQQVHQLPKEVRNLLAGGLAGMTAKSVVAPLDRVKILYQVSNVPFHLSSVPTVMRRIVQTEGVDALWKGNIATMVRVFPYSGIQFAIYDRIKSFFLQHHDQQGHSYFGTSQQPTDSNKFGLTPMESLIAGMAAGTCSVICTYPLDLTRAQLAVLKKHKYGDEGAKTKSFMGVLKDNYQRRGAVGLFRGITPTIIGILPYSGLAFTINEQGKKEIAYVTGRDLTTIERMICGAFAGLIAQTLTYPIEVTRRRMQTLGVLGNDMTAFSSLGGPVPAATTVTTTTTYTTPPTLMNTIRDLYREQGIRGFYKGVLMNWAKGPIAFSISFTAYDSMQTLFMSKDDRAKRLPLRQRLTKPSN